MEKRAILFSIAVLLTVAWSGVLYASGDSTTVVSKSQKLFGFNQLQYDRNNFGLRKLRLGIELPIGDPRQGISMVAYGDLDYGEPSLGFLVVNVRRGPWTFKFGQDLDPNTYQTDPPFMRRMLYYPAAGLFCPALGLGAFSQYSKGGIWWITGVTNGGDAAKDDNKMFDVTSRGIWTMSHSASTLSLAYIYRTGDQSDGYRRIYGADATFQSGRMYINAAHNWMSYAGDQRGGWATVTIDVIKRIQPLMMVEYLHDTNGVKAYGHVFGVSLVPAKNMVVRVNYYRQPFLRSPHAGAMLQVTF